VSNDSWVIARERGSLILLRFAVWYRLSLGRQLTNLILYPTVAYFFLTSHAARRASRAYLERLYRTHGALPGLSRRPSWWHPFVHIRSFSEGILDRFCFWSRRYESFDVSFHGREHLMRHVESGRGAILLGAHLGSFDALRVLAEEHDITVNVVMFTANAEQIESVFRQLDPEMELRIIHIEPGSIGSAFQIKACLDRGEFVAILGDRVGLGERQRVTWATFLGEKAPFPEGPIQLAIVLRAPALFTVALRTGHDHYQVIAEPFYDGEFVARSDRHKVVQEYVERFAGRLEHYCALAPFEWFNFYEFWQGEGSDAS
jgi:predicted LPLAT superfamily acyltransferase